MKTSLFAALLLAVGWFRPCVHAQQSEALRKQFQHYQVGAEQGQAIAQFNLGLCYHEGRGVEKDLSEAVKWFRKAAEQNDAKAQYNLGVCYDKGRGVEKDGTEAVKWFCKAAELGLADAQFNLGNCYYAGDGVEKDYAEAYAWFNLASMTDKDAAGYRDALEKKMSPQQVGDAQKRTKELRALIEAKLKNGR